MMVIILQLLTIMMYDNSRDANQSPSYATQMHADDFRNDHYGVVSTLRDGGYSDDMTLAAVAGSFFSFHVFIAYDELCAFIYFEAMSQ